MDYGKVAFLITTCLLMMLSGVFGKPREYSESTNIRRGDGPCNQLFACWYPAKCGKNGQKGHCEPTWGTCYCKLEHDENKGSKYLQLAQEISMKKSRRSSVENMAQTNDEQKPLTFSHKTPLFDVTNGKGLGKH